ncbi:MULTISPECIES: MipA/OmpV family protein [Pseudoalteromonas]|uniref:MipA/OmpV family protein n=1 Tax=Pseudoalteromonas viridis TaxID=339617 RepID=A0ABX7VCX7_9GAMM|nr:MULTISPECIES: MipA/OmpV family protein [Pseudoalteromonas]QTL37667.1 MipA/OmpV family protein [Pseudoalteromonas viridis]
MKRLSGVIGSVLFSSMAMANCETQPENCIEVSQWEFSVALGAGVATNPLKDGDHSPLIVLPYVRYYGDRFFLDNTAIGYTFYDHQAFDVSWIAELNSEQAFFSRSRPGTVLRANTLSPDLNEQVNLPQIEVPTSGEVSGDDNVNLPNDVSVQVAVTDLDQKQQESKPPSLTFDDLAKRRWAIDSGILAHWYISEQHKVRVRLLHDVRGIYNGFHSSVEYSYKLPFGDPKYAQLQLKLGVDYKDAKLGSYYYGITQRDTELTHYRYEVDSSFNPYVGMAYNHRLSKSWQFKFTAKHQWLGSSIANSPIVDEGYTTSVFIGGLYAF